MSFTFIESYGSDERTAQIGVRTYPVPCLVEDEDGIRLLVVADADRLLANVWHLAHAAGAVALAFAPEAGPLTEGQPWFWMLTETFMAERTEHHMTMSYVVPAAWSGPEDHLLTYRQMTASVHAEAEARQVSASGFVHLHAHSEFSPLDGMSTVDEMVREAVADGQQALAVTDHSGCAGHPALQFACDEAGIKPIFGIEANFTDDRHRRGVESVDAEGKKVSDAKAVLADYTHLVMWAMDDDGLRNLWAMSTEANRDGFYGRPRLDWDTLAKFSEGVMASTACLRGPLAQALLEGREEDARSILARLMGTFPDRLYVEVHTNTLPEQIRLNHLLVALAAEYDLPLIAAVDAHYPCKDDRETHQAWIAAQTNKDIQDDADLFAGGQHYHMATEAEVRAALAYLGPQVVDTAVGNTALVAERCNARIQGSPAAPIYSKVGGAQRDVDRLVEMCLGRWAKKVIGKPKDAAVYEARFEREMRLLIDKGFCGYFLMVADYCRAARAAGILVGPGRGSGGGSLVAYLADIVEIDPVDADLLFERFMTEGRTELPDFDVDFPASKRPWITNYIVDKYGEEYVVRVGTHIRLKNKGVVRDLARVLKTSMDLDYRDIEAVSAIIDEAESDKAGLGMDWEDLWVQEEERLAPYRAKYPLLFGLADKMVGRLKSYGKHAAGLVITTGEPLTGRLPMRLAGDDLVAEFDMKALEKIGLVKFDILTLRTLDTIQMAVDLVREQRGIAVDVYDWTEEYADPQVWEEIGDGHTMGIFQIETRSGAKMTREFKPTSLHELADVITLVRPGPKNSGLTATYLRRRAGGEPVTFPDPRLEEVLAKTFGCILYQEDLMATTMVLAGYDGVEADEVRSILGKKKVEKIPAAGRKFISQAVERGMDEDDCARLWEQMAEFAKYSFNRAHAYGYGVLGYWTAWLKFHYPVQFLAAVLSTVDKNRIPEFIAEARRMGYQVLPPDINESGVGFTASPLAVRYGLDNVKGVGEAGVQGVLAGQPYASFEDFLARKGSTAHSGVVKTLAAVGAFDSLVPDRRVLEATLEWESSADSGRCTFRDDTRNPLPCGFEWATEKDPPLIKSKGEWVPKPPPKRCTKACRNFTAPVLDVSILRPYTDEEIRAKEMELLGVHLSGTPFDGVPEEVLEQCRTADEVEAGPEGDYQVIAVLTKARKHITKTNKEMGFIGLFAQTGDLDVTVFTDEWARYRADLKPNALCLAVVRKNDRGLTLSNYHPIG